MKGLDRALSFFLLSNRVCKATHVCMNTRMRVQRTWGIGVRDMCIARTMLRRAFAKDLRGERSRHWYITLRNFVSRGLPRAEGVITLNLISVSSRTTPLTPQYRPQSALTPSSSILSEGPKSWKMNDVSFRHSTRLESKMSSLERRTSSGVVHI